MLVRPGGFGKRDARPPSPLLRDRGGVFFFLLPCYVIEVVVVAQQEMVFAAEDGGIYVRR